jgi:hypothetical protein
MMSKLPNFYLSEDEFKLIVGDGGWKINEIPLTLAGEIRGHFGIDTSYCVMASGVSPIPPKVKHQQPVAGIDWIRYENKPKPNEPDFNVYHYMITQKTDQGYPVFDMGAKDTVAPHWSELNDLKVYFKDWK